MNSQLGKFSTTPNRCPSVKCIFKGRITTLPLGGYYWHGEGNFDPIFGSSNHTTNADNNRVILDIYPMMKGEKEKVEKPTANAINQGRSANIVRNLTTQKRIFFGTLITWRTN